MGGLRRCNERGQGHGSTESIIFAAEPWETARKANPKTAGRCSATELKGKSRLQSWMSPVKETAKIGTQKRPEGGEC